MANITLRLHRQHDMDLIALFRTNDYKFAREMKKVLVAYANGEIYEPKTLDTTSLDGMYAPTYVPTSVTFHISLNEKNEDEAKALTLLSDIRVGYRNSFMKALFRSNIIYLPLIAFAKDNGLVMKKDTLEAFYRARMDGLKDKVSTDAKDVVNKETPAATIPVTKEVVTQVDETKDESPMVAETVVTKEDVADVVVPNMTEADDEEDFSDLFSQMSLMNN